MPNFCSPFSWIRFRPDLVQTAIYTNLLALILLLGYVQIGRTPTFITGLKTRNKVVSMNANPVIWVARLLKSN